MNVPADVLDYVRNLVSQINDKVSSTLSTFPFTHEEALDQKLISKFIGQGPRKLESGWSINFEAHYIGGGRHYRNFEVADLGLMVIFRKKGIIQRSKLVFLQSKKLFANSVKHKDFDPYHRQGMGRLLVTNDEHKELTRERVNKFKESSKYKALKTASDQEQVMSAFSDRHNVKLYYLFYNPADIPWSIKSPVEQLPSIEKNRIGCRVVPKPDLDDALKNYGPKYSPSFGDVKYQLNVLDFDKEHESGWRLEYFIVDLVIGCKEGLIDDSPNFETLHNLLSQKSSPISSALSITFDIP